MCIYSSGQFIISTMSFNIIPFLASAIGPYPYCLVQWSLLMNAVWYLICLVCWLVAVFRFLFLVPLVWKTSWVNFIFDDWLNDCLLSLSLLSPLLYSPFLFLLSLFLTPSVSLLSHSPAFSHPLSLLECTHNNEPVSDCSQCNEAIDILVDTFTRW